MYCIYLFKKNPAPKRWYFSSYSWFSIFFLNSEPTSFQHFYFHDWSTFIFIMALSCLFAADIHWLYGRGQKFWEWHKYKFSQSLLPQFVWLQFAYTPECYEEWSYELQLIAKSLFAMQMNSISRKHFHCISALPQKDQLTSCQWFSR